MTRFDHRVGGNQIIDRPAVWSVGPVAPWADSQPPSLAELLAAVGAHSSELPPNSASAVLVALADGPFGPEVLLTRRSPSVRLHKGEMCFPGGRIDAGETSIEAALREAHEEIGLEASLLDVHGELPHLHTAVNLHYIIPIVATLSERVVLTGSTIEVDRVMWVPIRELLRSDTHKSELWGAPPDDRLLHFFDLDDETVWGATARILVDLISAVYQFKSSAD